NLIGSLRVGMNEQSIGSFIPNNRVDDAAFFSSSRAKTAASATETRHSRMSPSWCSCRSSWNESINELSEFRCRCILYGDNFDSGVVAFDIQNFEHLIQLGNVGAGICHNDRIGLFVWNNSRISGHKASESA